MVADGRLRRMEEVARGAMEVVKAVRDAQVAVEEPTRESTGHLKVDIPQQTQGGDGSGGGKLQASVSSDQANARISLGAASQQSFQFVWSLVLRLEFLRRKKLQ
ncbi:hypothetical protein PsorP6_002391 [Peronosclerospora sorghi]|uniref:Uncharacterized protein n=1 Tax=Peronosclerospora sorghi TaxID=230839 RepID=A0ACC0WWX0_9STRA|nr:hypothetical protein PsorP6_002391 [Peronosclerospora sorghi]